MQYLSLGTDVTFLMRKKHLYESHSGKLQKISSEDFNFIELPELMTLSTRIKNSRRANIILKKAVLEHDIIIIRLPSKAGSLAFKYCKKYNKPYIVEFVACVFDAYWNYNWKGKIIAPYFFIKQRLMLRNLTFVIYVTNKFLQSRYPTRGVHIGLSDVELMPVSTDILKKRLFKIKSWDGKSPLILGTIAAIDVPYKGQSDVIKAIYLLKRQNTIFYYKMVGTGDKSKLQNLIDKYELNNQVEIIGPLPHEKIFSFLDNIDIYIQPSKQEGLPRSVIEAMSRGCPVLGANTGGISELIPENRIFPKGHYKRISEMIYFLLLKEEMMKDAERNFIFAKNYNINYLKKKRKLFYEKFLNYYDL